MFPLRFTNGRQLFGVRGPVRPVTALVGCCRSLSRAELVACISDIASTNGMPVGAALRGRPQIRASGTRVGAATEGRPYRQLAASELPDTRH